jgi:aspartyl protease family protein
MSPPNQKPPGRSIGKGMLIVSFSLGLMALTIFFNGVLQSQSNPNSEPEFSETDNGIKEVVLQRNRQGHYVANGTINGVPVTFLLDTGATDVAIPAAIARKAGLNQGYISQAATANGIIQVYSTILDELQLGNIRLHDIKASITPSMEGETILLGMSALKQIEFTQRGSNLTLRQIPAF